MKKNSVKTQTRDNMTVLDTSGVFVEKITSAPMNDLRISARAITHTTIITSKKNTKLGRVIHTNPNTEANLFFVIVTNSNVDLTLHYHISKNTHISHHALVIGSENAKVGIFERHECSDINGYAHSKTSALITDTSRFKYDGCIIIKEHAHNTDTRLDARIMLLSEQARAKIIPGLQIKTNEVRAKHSATVAKISDENLFYMRSRGLSAQEAHTLFLKGLILPFLSGLPQTEQAKQIKNIKKHLTFFL